MKALLIPFIVAVLASMTQCRKPAKDELIRTDYVCPDCHEWGCIYEEVDDSVDWSDYTDQSIKQVIIQVCNRRGITDTATIRLIMSNYSL